MTPPEAASSDPPAHPLRVLVVEDVVEHAFLLRSLLQNEGHEVALAQDGDRALPLLAEDWDLLVTDLNLPGTDGFQLTRAAKAKIPPIPVICTTAYTHPQYEEHALRAGADAFLLKPLEKATLLEHVARVVSEEASVPEPSPATLAVGARPGDVELGCGGALVHHVEEGAQVVVLVASTRGVDREAVERAVERLGARAVLPETARTGGGDPLATQELIERIAQEVAPGVVYLPSVADEAEDRRDLHRVARAFLSGADRVHGYLTATSTLDFRPDTFLDVRPAMLSKLEALAAYRDSGAERKDLTPRFAQAVARYWGRFSSFGEVEPFETLTQEA